jgi:hypothetical protein
MTYGYIEDLKFAVQVFDNGGNLIEVLARLHDLDAARAAFGACRTKYLKKLLYLCQGGRILRRSDRVQMRLVGNVACSLGTTSKRAHLNP